MIAIGAAMSVFVAFIATILIFGSWVAGHNASAIWIIVAAFFWANTLLFTLWHIEECFRRGATMTPKNLNGGRE